jgi:hypothetical protein
MLSPYPDVLRIYWSTSSRPNLVLVSQNAQFLCYADALKWIRLFMLFEKREQALIKHAIMQAEAVMEGERL